MATVYVSIGSNIDRERNILEANTRLVGEFGHVVFSPIYETEAVGFVGDAFLNLVARFETELMPDEMNARLHELEQEMGRAPGGPSFAPRGIDLDLLLYDDLVLRGDGFSLPRADIEKYAFVLRPLVDIAPDLEHPVRRVPVKAMLVEMGVEADALTQVPSEGLLPWASVSA